MINTNIEMQPCPFCGHTPEIEYSADKHIYIVICKDCYAQALGQTPEKAAEAWNEWAISYKDEIEQAKRLRPCPYCGGEAKLRDDGLFYAECSNCGAHGCSDKNRILAALHWNNRIMGVQRE